MSDETTITEAQKAELIDRMVTDVMADYLRTHEGTVSPYQISMVVNKVLKGLGSSYEVRPQMMYNYDKNGLIVKGVKGRKEYTLIEVHAFAVKFVTRNITK